MLREDIRIVVAGPHDSQIKVPENVILLGNVRDQNKLAELYSAADVTVITSKKETFFNDLCGKSLLRHSRCGF